MMHAVDWSDTLVAAAGGEPGKVCREVGGGQAFETRGMNFGLSSFCFGRYEG